MSVGCDRCLHAGVRRTPRLHVGSRCESCCGDGDPAHALYDTPITVRETGLHAGDKTTLSATSRAADNTTWTDSAQFAADPAGTVTTDQKPVSGSYRGIDAMGIVEDEAPGGNPDRSGFFVPRLS